VPRAYSLNITVTNTLGPGFISLYPTGGSAPLVSTLNYVAGQTIANAAIVPAGTGGGITAVAGVSGTDLIIDINGYYGDTLGTPGDYFTLTNNSSGFAIQGINNSTICSGPCGVEGVSQSGYAVAGFAQGASGIEYGVYGNESSSTDGAAGVYGVDFTGDPGGAAAGLVSAGVLGATKSHVGVLGKSRDAGVGVVGFSLNTSGTAVAGGYLGFANSQGIYYFNGLAGSGTKSFVEPHPTDATKLIKYVSIEGPEAGVYFRGRGHAHKGLATIDVPEDFRMVAAEEGLSIQVTPIGEMANVAVLQIDLNRVVVKATRDVEFFYTVNGVRRAYPTWNPIQENRREFVPEGPDARLPAYLSANETQRLIDNGTYNADGTVNMRTAEHAGWVKAWADRAAEAQAAAQEAQKAARARRE
jgi:hypothetical protein